MASEVRKAEDGKTRWQAGGEKVRYSGKQFWWSQHEPFFHEKLDTRGKRDVDSPVGQWTRVDVLCRGDRVTVATTAGERVRSDPTRGIDPILHFLALLNMIDPLPGPPRLSSTREVDRAA